MRALLCALALLALAGVCVGTAEGEAGKQSEDGSCASTEVRTRPRCAAGRQPAREVAKALVRVCAHALAADTPPHAQAIEKIEPKYKPSQAALTAFFKLHEPADDNWKAPFAVLEVTDGCPLNGMYRRFAPPCARPLRPSALPTHAAPMAPSWAPYQGGRALALTPQPPPARARRPRRRAGS